MGAALVYGQRKGLHKGELWVAEPELAILLCTAVCEVSTEGRQPQAKKAAGATSAGVDRWTDSEVEQETECRVLVLTMG